jgi:UDP-4-amino-4-deoxy-L-arabinose-oxoglutarate aminotransferase
MDIGPGDEVIVPAMTFIATANVVELVGAKPVFIDCDPETLLITPELIKGAITKKTKAIIPVHMYGQMCDVKAIREALPKDQKISIIEDCAHTFEAKFNGERPGKYSDAAIFSFYATKNVTCGEGGAIITNDGKLFDRIQQSILHGMSAGAADRFQAGQYKHWGMEHLGTKANLPDLLTCYLPEQIRTVDQRLSIREQIAEKYEKTLFATNIKFPKVLKGVVHSRHLFPIYVGLERRDKVLLALGEANIGATINYRAVHTMSFYSKKYGFSGNDFPTSFSWGNGTLSIPFFPGITTQEQDYVLDVLINKVSKMIGKTR